jgi:hypothetical protein
VRQFSIRLERDSTRGQAGQKTPPGVSGSRARNSVNKVQSQVGQALESTCTWNPSGEVETCEDVGFLSVAGTAFALQPGHSNDNQSVRATGDLTLYEVS